VRGGYARIREYEAKFAEAVVVGKVWEEKEENVVCVVMARDFLGRKERIHGGRGQCNLV
jgi:hypothetical protein